MCKPLPLPCNELCRLYEEERQTTITLSRRYGCSITTVANRLRRCGVTMRDGRFKAKVVPLDELLRLYVIEEWPINQIARHFGISVGTLYNRLNAADVPRRTAKLLLRELSVGYKVAGHRQAAQRPRPRPLSSVPFFGISSAAHHTPPPAPRPVAGRGSQISDAAAQS